MSYLKKYGKARIKDGRCSHPLYKRWKRIMTMCDSDKAAVCKSWIDPWNFYRDIESLFHDIGSFKYLVRIDARYPFHKDNVLFTNNTEAAVRGRVTTKKHKTDGVIVTTAQAKRMLKHKGVSISQGAISKRISLGSELLTNNSRNMFAYEGGLYSLKQIAEIEHLDYGTLKNQHAKIGGIQKSILSAREIMKSKKTYSFEGREYTQTELAKRLHELNPTMKLHGIRNRLKKGVPAEECLKPIRQINLTQPRGQEKN